MILGNEWVFLVKYRRIIFVLFNFVGSMVVRMG